MFPRIRVGPRAQHRILSQFSTLEEINPLQTTLYEWGIVSMRVGFVLRSAEIKPLFFDLFRSNKFLISGSYTLACPLDPSARLPAAAPPPLYTTGRVSLIHPVTWSLPTDKWRETKGHCHYSTSSPSSSLHIFDARRTWETPTSFCYHVSCWENSAGHSKHPSHDIVDTTSQKELTRRGRLSRVTSVATVHHHVSTIYG